MSTKLYNIIKIFKRIQFSVGVRSSNLWDVKERNRVKNAALLGIQILQDDEDYHMVF